METHGSTEDLYHRENAQRQDARMEKDHNTKVVSKEMESSIDAEKSSIEWAPGFLNRFPWLGFAALITMLTCVVLTIVVLKTSHNKAKEEWPALKQMEFVQEHVTWVSKAQIKPSVALAIINTVANIALAILIGQGVAISWWRSALEGATVKDLHQFWGFSTSVLELLTAGKKFNLIALAALAAKMALLDNLLLQQAADTVPSIFQQDNMNIRMPSVRVLPQDYAGIWDDRSGKGASSLLFSEDIKQYLNSPDFIEYGNSTGAIDTHCIGSCSARVAGFGFQVSCDPEKPTNGNWTDVLVTPESIASTEAFNTAERAREGTGNTTDIDITDGTVPPLLQIVVQETAPDDVQSLQIFSFRTIQLITQYSRLGINVANTTTCKSTQFTRTCYLQPATVEYPIQFTNFSGNPLEQSNPLKNTRTGLQIVGSTNDETLANPIDSLKNGQIQDIKVLEPAYRTDDAKWLSNMAAFTNTIISLFQTANVGIPLSYIPDKGYTIGSGSESTMQSWWIQVMSNWQTSQQCKVDVVDPMYYILEQLNSLMLRASIHAAVDPSDNTKLVPGALQENITATQVIDTVRYQSNYPFMWAAIALMLTCLLCVLPSYWRFWELGRRVTLGPIEISSAFQAPVLAHPGLASGGEVDILLKEVGNKKIRYGELQGEGRLGMAEPDSVIKLTGSPK